MAFVNGLDKTQKAFGVKHGQKYVHTVLKRPYNINLELTNLTSEIKLDKKKSDDLYKLPERSMLNQIYFGMGCFWGAEKMLWEINEKLGREVVFSTSIGYSGGHTTDPSYDSVGSGKTGHVEVVRVIYFEDSENRSYENSENLQQVLKVFWEHHDPTQDNGQANDIGPNYKSTVFCADDQQMEIVIKSKDKYQTVVSDEKNSVIFTSDKIVTDISVVKNWYLGEEMHQQYLDKHKWAFCGTKNNGAACPIEFGKKKDKNIAE